MSQKPSHRNGASSPALPKLLLFVSQQTIVGCWRWTWLSERPAHIYQVYTYVHIGIDGHDKRALIRGRKCSNWSTRNARGPIVWSRAGNWRQHWSQHDPHQSQSAAWHSEKYLDWKWIRLTRFFNGKIARNLGRKEISTCLYSFITNKFFDQR